MRKSATPPPHDPVSFLKSGKAVCMAPWVHAHLSSLGDFTPCCEIFEPVGPSDGKDIDTHWNSDEMAALRLAMLGDEPLSVCRKCADKEKAGLVSRRHKFNTEFSEQAHRLSATEPDGRLPADLNPIDFDLRFSNLCNFRCRSCWHGASSRWFSDAAALRQTKAPSAIITAGADRDRTLAQAIDQLPNARSLYFAGGEPLLMREHYDLLEELVRLRRTDVKLSYNSNLSTLNLGDRHVTDLWSHFDDIQVAVSLDGMGAIGELIRKGLECSVLEKNIHTIRERSPNVKLVLAVTVSVLNIFHIPALHAYARETLGFDASSIMLNPLQDPAHYNIQLLPREMKHRAASFLANLAQTHPTASGPALDLVAYMWARDRSKNISAFVRITDELDRLRGEDTFALIPELLPLRAISARLGTRWGRASFRLREKLIAQPGTT